MSFTAITMQMIRSTIETAKNPKVRKCLSIAATATGFGIGAYLLHRTWVEAEARKEELLLLQKKAQQEIEQRKAARLAEEKKKEERALARLAKFRKDRRIVKLFREAVQGSNAYLKKHRAALKITRFLRFTLFRVAIESALRAYHEAERRRKIRESILARRRKEQEEDEEAAAFWAYRRWRIDTFRKSILKEINKRVEDRRNNKLACWKTIRFLEGPDLSHSMDEVKEMKKTCREHPACIAQILFAQQQKRFRPFARKPPAAPTSAEQPVASTSKVVLQEKPKQKVDKYGGALSFLKPELVAKKFVLPGDYRTSGDYYHHEEAHTLEVLLREYRYYRTNEIAGPNAPEFKKGIKVLSQVQRLELKSELQALEAASVLPMKFMLGEHWSGERKKSVQGQIAYLNMRKKAIEAGTWKEETPEEKEKRRKEKGKEKAEPQQAPSVKKISNNKAKIEKQRTIRPSLRIDFADDERSLSPLSSGSPTPSQSEESDGYVSAKEPSIIPPPLVPRPAIVPQLADIMAMQRQAAERNAELKDVVVIVPEHYSKTEEGKKAARAAARTMRTDGDYGNKPGC